MGDLSERIAGDPLGDQQQQGDPGMTTAMQQPWADPLVYVLALALLPVHSIDLETRKDGTLILCQHCGVSD